MSVAISNTMPQMRNGCLVNDRLPTYPIDASILVTSTENESVQWSGVKMRQKKPQTAQEKTETQRKRNSRNRLSNRRSTGFVTPEEIEAALMFQQSTS